MAALLLAIVATAGDGGGVSSTAALRARVAPRPKRTAQTPPQVAGQEPTVSADESTARPAAKDAGEIPVPGTPGEEVADAPNRRIQRLALQRPAWLPERAQPDAPVLRLERLEAVPGPDGAQHTRRREIEVKEEDLTCPVRRWHGDLALGIGTDDTWDSRVRLWTTIRDGVHLGLSAGVGRYHWPEWDRP